MTAAEWSAIAALFAAFSSFMIYRTQRSNLLEAVRPEIVLADWERRYEGQGATAHEVLNFRNITNTGRGAAMHVIVNLEDQSNPPVAGLGTIQIPILSPSESSEIDAQITLWWKNVAPFKGTKFLHINLKIFCWDTKGMRHETRYYLLLTELGEKLFMTNEVAPGVGLGSRQVKIRPVWFLKLAALLRPYWERVQDFVAAHKPDKIGEAQQLVQRWWREKLEGWTNNEKKK